MDAEIQFGDVEEERPRMMRRPDENRHYAVSTCGAPREAELRVYVDLDAMLEMESHAVSNTNVELGGVLLGGQYVDHDGRAFVIVSDCLRADHYEATKGSFKFTHDTWSDISRRLEEYPNDLRMVGWYHTHPDWGVFLSGMDIFICENFFNKPLDLALVIDPCRGDRGWFQWASQHRRGPQRMGGFYLTSSRFREEELEHWARMLEGSVEMPLATRSGSQMSGGYGAPVVNVVQDRSSQWTQVAVLGSLALQTMLVALLAWGVIARSDGVDGKVAQKLKEQEIALNEKRETLDHIAARLSDTDENFVKSYEDTELERRSLKTALDTASRFQRAQNTELEKLQEEIGEWKKYEKKVTDEHEVLKKENLELKARNKELTAALNEKPGSLPAWFDLKSPWLWTIIGITVVAVVCGVLIFRSPRPVDDESAENEDLSSSPRGNSPTSPSKEMPDETNTR